MKTQKLSALAKTIRSKNAGMNLITFDIIFAGRATYDRVKRARVLTRETVCKLYGIPDKRISDFVEFDSGNAIKYTLYRLRSSGSPGRSGHLRRAAVCAAAGCRGAGRVDASK